MLSKAFANLTLTSFNKQQINLTQFKRWYNFSRCHTIFHDRHQMKYKKRLHDDNWVRRRGGGWDEHLTKANEEFIASQIKNSYSPLKNAPWPKQPFTPNSIRTGVIAMKIGSIPQWTKEGKRIHCSLLQILDNHVIDYLPPTKQPIRVWTTNRNPNLIDSTKMGVCVVGALSCDPRKFTRVYNKLFLKAGCLPKRKLSRFFVTPNAALQPGTSLNASHFRVGDYVDVQAKTIDYGFQGCMRRYGFKGQNKAHGVCKAHRKRGSVGSGRKRKCVIAGTKMPGFMGNRLRFLRGLKIWRIDNKHNVIYVNGPCIPGPMHSYVRVHDTTIGCKKALITQDNHPPFPTHFEEDEKRPTEEFDVEIHKFSDSTLF